MKTIVYVIAALVASMTAMPKAIGLTLALYLDTLHSTFGDGGPADVKALHEAMEKAFKAMQDNITKVQDTANNALEETRKEGTLHGETSKKLTELGEAGNKLSTDFKEVRERVLAIEQKAAQKHHGDDDSAPKSVADIVIESEEFKACMAQGAQARNMPPVLVKTFQQKTQIVNATGQNQPLVYSQRLDGIITPAQRRLTIRDLLPAGIATSNLIEFVSEATFTSNARPQGDVSPIGNGEGELKAESAMTFTLANTPVTTIAHWIPASRQVLQDANLLQGHISGRLIYGLKLEEEGELLTGTGGAGTLNGLVNQAASFTGGVTNQTALDTILKAFLQVSLSNYEASGLILHPTDWANIMLLKDTTGRYLFTNPQDVVAPRLWAKPVVATQTMTLGRFLAGAFDLAAQIWDKEDAMIRISENVNDHFVRNMVAILAEERLALAVYRTAALCYGSVSNSG